MTEVNSLPPTGGEGTKRPNERRYIIGDLAYMRTHTTDLSREDYSMTEILRVPVEEVVASEEKRKAMDDWGKALNRHVVHDPQTKEYVFYKDVEPKNKRCGPTALPLHRTSRKGLYTEIDDEDELWMKGV